jgi:hypothetical protein
MLGFDKSLGCRGSLARNFDNCCGFQGIRVQLVKAVPTLTAQFSAAQRAKVFRNSRTGNGKSLRDSSGGPPCRTRSSTERRVGSARALKIASGEYVIER